jgi:hypothetical protein
MEPKARPNPGFSQSSVTLGLESPYSFSFATCQPKVPSMQTTKNIQHNLANVGRLKYLRS